jgi:diguanylate cyclase (GGDEF)-like protein
MIAERDGGGRIHRATDKLHQRVLDIFYDTDVGVMADIDALPTSPEKRAMLRERGTRSIVYIWLRSEAERIGLIVLEYREILEFGEDQLEDLTAIGKAISMALSNVLFIARVEHQATHDTLTALSNRELLQRELESLTGEPERACGLILLDLDRFKEVNDTLGHHVGDQLLIVLAQRLTEALREKNALLCRLGGDEFAILVRDLTPAQLQAIAESLLELLRQPFHVGELILEIGGSIGIAMYPQQGRSGTELLRLADVAMYEAKRNGNGWMFYDRQFDSYTPDRLALMQELRGAIVQKQLVLHFQPRLNLHTDEIVGFEALVRWQHPQRGLLAPNVFLPLAEMSDVIHALTIEVLELALVQQRDWLQRGLRYAIAVNLSARNLINEQCFIRLRQMIEKYACDPNLLELEITETALMQDPVGAAKLLSSLAALGIKFSIDDFGTGYSSLAYLRQLPIHALKIDRSFISDMVRNEQDAMIVKSTIALAHNLKLDVIAEGVEDEVTLRLLHSMGCDQVQGYYISRPQPVAVIEPWLEQPSWPRLR